MADSPFSTGGASQLILQYMDSVQTHPVLSRDSQKMRGQFFLGFTMSAMTKTPLETISELSGLSLERIGKGADVPRV